MNYLLVVHIPATNLLRARQNVLRFDTQEKRDQTLAGMQERHPDQKLEALENPGLTKEEAMEGYTFEHVSLKYADGKTPIRCRRNGACKVWKTRPAEFKLPVKYGLKECFYLTDENAHEWRKA